MRLFSEGVECSDFYTIKVESADEGRCEITLTDTYSSDEDKLSAILTLDEVYELQNILSGYCRLMSNMNLK